MDLSDRIKSIRRSLLSCRVQRDKLFGFQRFQTLMQGEKIEDVMAHIDFEVLFAHL